MIGKFKVTGNIIGILLLMGILFSYAMFQGGFASWFLFYSFLPIFIYQLLFFFYPFKKWEVTREITRGVVQAGDEVFVTIHLKRKTIFPIFYCSIKEEIPDTLMSRDLKKEKYRLFNKPEQLRVNRKLNQIVFPLFRKQLSLTYGIQQIPRGEHKLKAITLRVGDIFGLVKKEFTVPVTNQIVAYPYVHSLKMKDRITSFEQGAIASAAMNQANTTVATGVREYAPGDRVSWIDWKQTARKQDVMTKEFEQEKSTELLVIHDSCAGARVNPLAYEASIEMSASILVAFQKEDHEANFLSIGQESHYFPSEYGERFHSPMNRYLLHARPGGSQSFSVRLREEFARMGRADTIFLIVTHLDDFLMKVILEGKQGKKYMGIFFIQSEALVTESEHRIVEQLRHSNIHVQMINAGHLLDNPIEVNFK